MKKTDREEYGQSPEEEDLNFDKVQDNETTSELGIDDFKGADFLKNPEVGGILEFVVDRVVENKVTTGVNSLTGKEFTIGVTDKNKKTKRIDIISDEGKTYTVSNWEIYFKLFGKDGLLIQYAKAHENKFKGAKLSIKRLLNGAYMSYNLNDLAKILGVQVKDAEKVQNEIKQAVKEQRLYEIKLV